MFLINVFYFCSCKAASLLHQKHNDFFFISADLLGKKTLFFSSENWPKKSQHSVPLKLLIFPKYQLCSDRFGCYQMKLFLIFKLNGSHSWSIRNVLVVLLFLSSFYVYCCFIQSAFDSSLQGNSCFLELAWYTSWKHYIYECE